MRRFELDSDIEDARSAIAQFRKALEILPGGLIPQDFLVRHLAAGAGLTLPASFVHVLTAPNLALLALAGLGIAAAGSLGPATWAVTAKTTTALRAE